MTMARFAPGPWRVTGQSEGGRYITVKAHNGRTVARVPWNTDKEAEANQATDDSDAKLIAKAPEMHGLLEAIREYNRQGLNHWDYIQAEVNRLLTEAEKGVL
jgi:hypothetical protein